MHHLTLAGLSAALDRGETTSEELTRHFLARIERLDPALNSFVTVTAERALAKRAPRMPHAAGAKPGP